MGNNPESNKNTKKLVSIVAPVYNEEDVIGQFIERIIKIADSQPRNNFELILVDDGSEDQSLKIIKDHAFRDERIQIVELMRNYGQTSALSAGIDKAQGNIIITMDSDLQHFPEEIPLFLEKIDEGYDLVCGWRRERREGIVRRWPSSVANYFIYKISGIKIHDFGTTFRAYRREILDNMQLFGDMHRFIPAFASRLGGKIIEIPIRNIERPSGKSSYNISRTYGVSLDLFFLFFYLNYFTKPIRIFGLLAVLLFGPGFMIALIEVILAFTGVLPPGNEHLALLLFCVLLMILGVNFLCYGIIAEVQNRIYFSVRKEKLYSVRSIWQKNTNQ
jgi:glycosyltransferase involved in cell wall biosynthesis